MSNVQEYGAAGNGKDDDTAAIRRALREGDGTLHFPAGSYRITETVHVALEDPERFSLEGGDGAAKIVMAGQGPAFHLEGTHDGTANPQSFAPEVWAHERMPMVSGIEIEGAHEEAGGFLLERTMQSTFRGVLLRNLRHGIHVRRRARNVLIAHCHLYNNRGVGIFFDHANLHQVIISHSHISYNKLSGIKILNGEVRNVQITGCDIEYNYDKEAGEDAPPAAEIWLDTRGKGATLREGAIVSNTIQSRYSPGGANIMMLGRGPDANHQLGMFTIFGNLLGSQESNVRLDACRAVVLGGNVIYSGHRRNVHVTNSHNIVASGNTFGHNPGYEPKQLATGVTFERCTECTFSGSQIRDADAGEHTVQTPVKLDRKGLIEIVDCERFTLSGCQVHASTPYGVYLRGCDSVNVNGCTVRRAHAGAPLQAAVRWAGEGKNNQLHDCILAAGEKGPHFIDDSVDVHLADNTAVKS